LDSRLIEKRNRYENDTDGVCSALGNQLLNAQCALKRLAVIVSNEIT